METDPTSPRAAELPSLERHPSSDQVFQRLLEGAPDAVVVVNAGGCIVFANEQTERLFQYDRGALVGQPLEILVPERLRATHVQRREHFMTLPRTRPMGSGLELLGRRSDGTDFPVEISLSPVPTSDGVLVSASVRDISERRAAEATARRLQAQLLSAVESIEAAFAIFDADEHLVLCNSEYRQLIESRLPGQVTGRSFAELLGCLANGILWTEDAATPPLEPRWLAYHRSPIGFLDVRTLQGRHLRVMERRTAEGGTVMTISDITADALHEEELRHARSLAEAASSAKSEFLASMSHELRTPLNAVLGFAQLLERDRKTPLSERQLERIQHVLRGGEHLLRLIDDVLDLARIESGRVSVSPERVDVAEMLARVKSTLAPLAARGEIQISVGSVPVAAAFVQADRTRLEQVLVNYGSNAVKYGRRGGTVVFSVDVSDGMTRITVQDDGIGIAPAKQPTLFQPFQRAGQEAGPIEGTGIGLAISKRLAELMRGRVGFESTEGQGSTFWIELPTLLAEPPPAVSPHTPPRASALLGMGEGPRHLILYVEDNPSNIAFMRDLLADFERVELITAPSAEIGIDLARARPPGVIIMDINLPGMSGIEASHALRQWPETRHIPILALSAAAMIRDAARVAGAGFHRYLTKPVQVDELVEALEELIQ